MILSNFKIEKVSDTFRELAADFVHRESEHTSLITVTNFGLSRDLKTAIVFISVYPEEKENEVLDFLKRKAGELKQYVTEHIRTRKIPSFDFALDRGEKNRQRIDELV